jgi:hypothetical protein
VSQQQGSTPQVLSEKLIPKKDVTPAEEVQSVVEEVF